MRHPLARPLLAGVLARTTLNIAYRLAYPFLPVIARGLGVPLEAAASLVALRASLGFAGLAVGPLADRYRRRTLILVALTLFVGGALVAASVPLYFVFSLGFLLTGLAKIILDPTLVAYLSDRVPYELRGRVSGLNELPWSLASLVGLPLVGLAMARWGWQSPYWGLAALGVVSLLVARWGFAARDERPLPTTRPPILQNFAAALAHPSVRWMWLVTLAVVIGNDVILIIYGTWLESAYGLSAAGLGTVAIATGLAELVGEGVSAALLDRVGKKRGILAGLALLLASFPTLPILGGYGVAGAVAGLVLVLFAFEFAYISCIPLVSELVPSARATTLSLNSTASQTGRVLGSLLGPLVWGAAGLWGSVGVSSALTFAAGLMLLVKVREGTHPKTVCPSTGHDV